MPPAPSTVPPSMDDANVDIKNTAPTTLNMKTTPPPKLEVNVPAVVNKTSLTNGNGKGRTTMTSATGGNITVTVNNNNSNNNNNKNKNITNNNNNNVTNSSQPKMKSLSVGGVAIVPKTPAPGLAAALEASGVRVVSSPADLQVQQPVPLSLPLNVVSQPTNSYTNPLVSSLPLPPPPPPPPPPLTPSSPLSQPPSTVEHKNGNLSNSIPSGVTPLGSPRTRTKSSSRAHEHNTRRHSSVTPLNIPALSIPTNPQLNPPPLPPNPNSNNNHHNHYPNTLAWSPSPRASYSNLTTPASSNPNMSLQISTPSASPANSPLASPKASSPTSVSAALSDLAVIERALQKKVKSLQSELKDIESGIGVKEDEYIAETWSHGNVIRGWDNFLRRAEKSEKAAAAAAAAAEGEQNYAKGAASNGNMTKSSGNGRKGRVNDHIFSLSSSSSKIRRDNPDIAIPKRPSVIAKRKKKRG